MAERTQATRPGLHRLALCRLALLAAALTLVACEPSAPPLRETGLTYLDILCREDPLACRHVP